MVSVRVAPLDDAAMQAFVSDPATVGMLPNERPPELVRLAAGAPGSLVGADDRTAALARARLFLAAADGGREQVLRAAFTAGSSKARGSYADVLDALTVLVHERARDATARGDDAQATRAARAVPLIEDAKRAAEGNANPQLVTAQLLDALSAAGSRA